ncbi:hypothetical protein [Halovivax cerinus]|uniref:Uncharacterized protein n=1 Tax=Halovivax cerinus TaxID=1487865 RepID=A0ABD5NQN5_9EURY|nr:hypothetical protein [Halovivax cerinus]
MGRTNLEAKDEEKYLNDQIPGRVIVDTNTRLYEPPTKGDLTGFGTEDFRKGNQQRQGATNIADDEIVDPAEIRAEMAVQIDLAVSREIGRWQSSVDMKEMDRTLG